MQDQVTRGRARAIACSNMSGTRIQQAVAAAGNGASYCALQQRFTYLTPAHGADLHPHVLLDDDVASRAAQAGLVLLGYSPLLGGAYTRAERPLMSSYTHSGSAAQRLTLAEVAQAYALDAGQVVLAWMSQREQPVVPVVGVSNLWQLHSAVEAVATALAPESIVALEKARRQHQ